MSTVAPAVKAAPLRVRSRITATIRGLGIAYALLLACYALLSWGMAVVVPPAAPEPLEAAWFDRFAGALGGAAGEFVRGTSWLADRPAFLATYCALLLGASVLFVLVLAALSRSRASLSEANVRQMLHWSVGFAAILVFAVPVLVQDFWLSAGWGRLVARGANPYYVSLSPQITQGLPLDYLGLLTTYGPLWTLLCGVVMLAAGGSGIAAGFLFKLVLGAAWCGALVLVRRLMRRRPVWDQCIALAIAGWLPLTLIHIMADGHNDIAMVVLVLLWLWLLERDRPLSATAALAASVVMKYLSAPLLLLDLAHHRTLERRPWLGYWPRAALAGVIGIGAVAVFYRSPAFFAATAHMTEWHFFTPRDGVVAAARLLGVEPGLGSVAGVAAAGLAVGLQLFFIGIGVWAVLRHAGRRDAASFRYAVFGVAAAMLFGVAGHVWPWFLAWVVLMAALQPGTRLCRWTVGVALAAPFPLVFWVMYPGLQTLARVTPPLYLAALAWFVFSPRTWLGSGPARPPHPLDDEEVR